MTARSLEDLKYAATRCKRRGMTRTQAEKWLRHWGPEAARVIAQVYA
jgi:hypothetical protein